MKEGEGQAAAGIGGTTQGRLAPYAGGQGWSNNDGPSSWCPSYLGMKKRKTRGKTGLISIAIVRVHKYDFFFSLWSISAPPIFAAGSATVSTPDIP